MKTHRPFLSTLMFFTASGVLTGSDKEDGSQKSDKNHFHHFWSILVQEVFFSPGSQFENIPTNSSTVVDFYLADDELPSVSDVSNSSRICSLELLRALHLTA